MPSLSKRFAHLDTWSRSFGVSIEMCYNVWISLYSRRSYHSRMTETKSAHTHENTQTHRQSEKKRKRLIVLYSFTRLHRYQLSLFHNCFVVHTWALYWETLMKNSTHTHAHTHKKLHQQKKREMKWNSNHNLCNFNSNSPNCIPIKWFD